MPIQMIGQRLAAMLAGGFAFFGPCGGLNLLFGSLGNLFFFREGQIELIKALGLRPKPVTVMPRKLVLKLLHFQAQRPDLIGQKSVHRPQFCGVFRCDIQALQHLEFYT